jgi:hypothetical protein
MNSSKVIDFTEPIKITSNQPIEKQKKRQNYIRRIYHKR